MLPTTRSNWHPFSLHCHPQNMVTVARFYLRLCQNKMRMLTIIITCNNDRMRITVSQPRPHALNRVIPLANCPYVGGKILQSSLRITAAATSNSQSRSSMPCKWAWLTSVILNEQFGRPNLSLLPTTRLKWHPLFIALASTAKHGYQYNVAT